MNTPKLNDLQNSILSAFETRFGTINRGLKSTFRTISQVLAGELRLVYLYAARIQQNSFADLAESELNGGTLERFGRARLGRDPFPASQGVYLLDVTGTIGGVIREGVIFKASNGYNYSNESSFTFDSSVGLITVRALTPGLVAQLLPGDILNATEPMLNADGKAIVNTELETPLNAEDLEDYRAKIMLAFRTESQGGASGDYRLWSSDAQGVEQVYPFVTTPGTINLYIEATEEDSIAGDGVPTQTIIDNVQAVVELDPDTTKDINDRGRLPMGIYEINYLPVSIKNIGVEITEYTGNISEAQTLILAALKTYLKTIRPYVAGADLTDLSNLSAQRLVGVVTSALPVEQTFTNLVMTVDSIELANYRFTNGNIPYPNSVIVTV